MKTAFLTLKVEIEEDVMRDGKTYYEQKSFEVEFEDSWNGTLCWDDIASEDFESAFIDRENSTELTERGKAIKSIREALEKVFEDLTGINIAENERERMLYQEEQGF